MIMGTYNERAGLHIYKRIEGKKFDYLGYNFTRTENSSLIGCLMQIIFCIAF